MERWFSDSNRNISGRCVRMFEHSKEWPTDRECSFQCELLPLISLFLSLSCETRKCLETEDQDRDGSAGDVDGNPGRKSQEKERHEIHVRPCMSCLSSHLVLSKMRMEGGCRSHSYCTSRQSTMLFKLSSEEDIWKKVGKRRKWIETSYQRGTSEQEAKWYHVLDSCPTCERSLRYKTSTHSTFNMRATFNITHIHKRQD